MNKNELIFSIANKAGWEFFNYGTPKDIKKDWTKDDLKKVNFAFSKEVL